ncbi:sugar phosphate isomerase/epimerase [Flagellimonas sp.]|uniref:sugar phosphate isomerase/epimerase n=1 Tax=Flagellimonas sp. TaxID=2058762 RepID=UPI003F49DB0A
MNSITYLNPFWGKEKLNPKEFIHQSLTNGFDGIEINIPNIHYGLSLYDELNDVRKKKSDFLVCLQCLPGANGESINQFIENTLEKLENLVQLAPNFINSHTGKDYYSFSENCKVIEAIEDFSIKHGVPIYHEIHRGRFSFHSTTTIKYLEVFPELKFVGDLSHWCVTSESMLENQEEVINTIIPNIYHIHARVGSTQSPQVNHPFAPEWDNHLKRFVNWWQAIVDYHKAYRGISITPEFGPFPYMPNEPFTRKPLSNQNDINNEMKDYLKSTLQ